MSTLTSHNPTDPSEPTDPFDSSSATMAALVLHAIGDLRVDTLPRPEPRAGEVLVRVAACGVCGSDLPRIFEKGAYRFPMVCGHEFSGTIAERGPGVEEFAIGCPVTVFPLIWCGRCPACEQGRYAQCADYDYLGSRSNGAFAEFVAVPRRNLLPLPDAVSMEEAALTEPAAVALHALGRAGGVTPGEKIVIFGAGPIGLMAAQWAAISGAGAVILFDVAPDKLQLARSLGFRYCFHAGETPPESVLPDLTDGLGADIAIEAAGVPATMTQCLAAAAVRGRVVLLGNPAAPVTLQAPLISTVMRRELAIFGTWNSDFSAAGNRDDWRTVLANLASGALSLAPLISHRVPLAHAADLLARMRDKSEPFSRVIIQPNQE